MGPGPGEVIAILAAIGTPSFLIFYFAKRWFALKEKRLEIDARLATEKAAQYVARTGELEQRLATIERIVTDGGLETAAQIEALRTPRLKGKEAAQ